MKLRDHMKVRSRELRKNATPAERKLWVYLRGKQLGGFRFLRQHAVGTYVPDFYCSEARLAVELDGSVHSLPETAGYDRNRTNELAARAIEVLRFSNDRVMNETGQVLNEILAALRRRMAEKP